MINKTFNLTNDPWIKVVDKDTNQTKTVSLIDLFKNAQDYRQFAGEMRSQDLAILRFLLAILTTVYSRFDADGKPYKWLKIDDESMQNVGDIDRRTYKERTIITTTWRNLYDNGHFSEIVVQYLHQYADRFDLFGERPFYQVTEAEYNDFVPAKKQISDGKGPGTVAVKQMNRQISESGNTPAIFSPKAGEFKNETKLDELARWLITYQNFTGVTDKTKIETKEKFSASAGWLYKLNPVFVDGDNVFQTLMLNLILVGEKKSYASQKPVWEYEDIKDYVIDRKKQILPDNLSELYTTWSRLLHIYWDENGKPTIFSAELPMFEAENALIEPMTVWKKDKKTNGLKPAVKGLRSLGRAMWRNFGQYVNASGTDDNHIPGIVVWLQRLKKERAIPWNIQLTLASVALVSDGNATSQAPVAEVYDDMHIRADVLFDDDPDKATYWPARIAEVIELTQKIGSDYWQFAADVARIRNIDVRTFANQLSAKFYAGLNRPFKSWLKGLTNQDERDVKIKAWQDELGTYVMRVANEIVQSSSQRDVTGFVDLQGTVDKNKGVVNIFTVTSFLKYRVQTDLDPSTKKG